MLFRSTRAQEINSVRRKDIYITENGCSATDVPAADGIVYDDARADIVSSQRTTRNSLLMLQLTVMLILLG